MNIDKNILTGDKIRKVFCEYVAKQSIDDISSCPQCGLKIETQYITTKTKEVRRSIPFSNQDILYTTELWKEKTFVCPYCGYEGKVI